MYKKVTSKRSCKNALAPLQQQQQQQQQSLLSQASWGKREKNNRISQLQHSMYALLASKEKKRIKQHCSTLFFLKHAGKMCVIALRRTRIRVKIVHNHCSTQIKHAHECWCILSPCIEAHCIGTICPTLLGFGGSDTIILSNMVSIA